MHMADTALELDLPMERPLHTPRIKPQITDFALEAEDVDVETDALFSQVVIDKAQLTRHIRHTLQARPQVTLRELCELRPLQQGLAELVAYLQLADDTFKSLVDEETTDVICWRTTTTDGQLLDKQAQLPRVIFLR